MRAGKGRRYHASVLCRAHPDADLATEAARNGRMLDGLEAVDAPLQRVVIYQGFKIYGIHLGAKVRTPAREDDPPHMPPNIYQAQEAQLNTRAEKSRWEYVALLGRASAWAAIEAPGGEAFNVTNVDTFRWERMFEDIADHLGMDTAHPVPITLAEHMADKGDLWRKLAEKHDLIEPDLTKLVGWGFGDFIFNTETDVVSDTNKIHRHGFTERMDSSRSLLAALDRLKAKRFIP